MAIPISPTSTRRSTAQRRRSSATAMSRSTCARILSKTRAEFDGSDIVGHALDALDGSAIRTITILGRRGPHQIAMTPKELGELGHLEAAEPESTPPTFRRSRPTRRSSPARASRSRILREFAAPRRCGKPKHIAFDFFASPVRDRGRRPGRAADRRAHRARRRRAERRHRRDLCHPGEPDRQLHRLSDPADRRRAL